MSELVRAAKSGMNASQSGVLLVASCQKQKTKTALSGAKRSLRLSQCRTYSTKINRKAKGNILILTCMGILLVALGVVAAYSFCGLYFVHNRLQASAEEIALEGAKKLNDRDRIGQMNNMIVRNRQLVYSTRQDLEKVKKDFSEVESFAEQLMDESRDSANQMEVERNQMTKLAYVESMQAMQGKFDSIKKTYAMILPWLHIKTPQVDDVGFGRINGVESNVPEFKIFDKLQSDDRNQNLVDTSNSLNLYKGNINEPLKSADADLTFNIASLPAPIQTDISPARVLLTQNYFDMPEDNKFTPTATKVILTLDVQSGIGWSAAGRLEAEGAAVTAGAGNQM